MMKTFRPAYFLALAAFLTGCATAPDPRETYAPRAILAEPPMEILIETSPAGGIVDWNGNVLGAAPVTLTIRPDRMASGRPRWPETGALTHYFRARWPNGARAFELFQPSEMPPQHIAIVCPGAANPLLDSLRADARTLTQKKPADPQSPIPSASAPVNKKSQKKVSAKNKNTLALILFLYTFKGQASQTARHGPANLEKNKDLGPANPGKKMENQTYQVITDRLVTMLESGTIPWRKPWAGASGFPKNLISKKEYSGINFWMLHSADYGSPYWLTFKQAQELGGTVRKGEKGTPVIFTKNLPPKVVDAPTGNGGSEKMIDGKKLGGRMLKYYTAFNVEQCDGLTLPDDGPRHQHDPITSAEAIREGYQGPTIAHGGGRACYSPALDLVKMPEAERFEHREEYYSVLFHELAHSTGHKTRLARITETANFGSENYGKEELVAEMASAYLCGHAGIEQATLENSAAYLKGWIDAIKGDTKLAISAASAATKASNLILNK